MTARRADVDLIRGFAMLTIVLTHVADVTLPATLSGPMGLLVGSASLFFMTSGALNLPVAEKPSAFYRRRILRLAVVFVVWSVVYAFLNVHFDAHSRPLAEQLKWLIVTPTWAPGWFVYALIGLYLAMPVISPWLKTATPRQLNMLICAWLATGLLPLAALHTGVNILATALTPFTGFLGYAVAGYWLTRKPLRLRYALLLIGLGLIFGGRVYLTGLKYGWQSVMTNDLSINIMMVNIGIFALCMAWQNVPRWVLAPFRVISKYSLGVYLAHWLVIEVVVAPFALGFVPALLITLAASLIVAIAQDKLINSSFSSCERT